MRLRCEAYIHICVQGRHLLEVITTQDSLAGTTDPPNWPSTTSLTDIDAVIHDRNWRNHCCMTAVSRFGVIVTQQRPF